MKQFVLEYERQCAYDFGGYVKFKKVNRTEFIDGLLRFNKYDYGAITTEVKKAFSTRHVLVADLDSSESLLAAKHWVSTEWGLGTAIIASSINHFWMIIDLVDKWQEIVRCLEILPGVDSGYISLSLKRKALQIRMIPRIEGSQKGWRGLGCRGQIIDPNFEADHDLKLPEAIELYNFLKNWYTSAEYARLKKALILRNAIKNGEVSEMAQNPGFIV